MEVHHHSHSSRKKWTHYIWEFFMLFLAVTLGFFVENQREHYVEHLREKQYARSLYTNLKSDTVWIRRTIAEKTWVLEKADSLIKILSSPGEITNNNELIYYFERFMRRRNIFTGNDLTYRQLINSGNFRYFKNLGLNSKIANYYIMYDRYHAIGESEYGKIGELTQLESILFNGGDLTSLTNPDAGTFYENFKRPDTKFQPVNTDPQVRNSFQIKVGIYHYAISRSRALLIRLDDFGAEAIEEIKKEYHFE